MTRSEESSNGEVDTKKKKHKHKSKKKRRHRYDSSSESSDSYRKNDKKHKRKRKHRKKHKHDYSSDESSNKPKLLKTLTKLVSKYPPMIQQIPFILYKMIQSETTYNVCSMEPKEIGVLLEELFTCMNEEYGDDIIVKVDGVSWGWNKKLGRNENDMKLVRILKVLLDNCGVTMDAIQQYESSVKSNQPSKTATMNESIQEIITTILKKQSNQTLAKEIYNLCTILNQNELISLDTIPDTTLQAELKRLFDCIGLELIDMEDDDKGYGLPEEEERGYEDVKSNLGVVMDTCTTIINEMSQRDEITTSEIDVKGNQLPSTLNNSSDDDEMIGPSLPSSKTIPKISTQAQMLEQAKKRQEELNQAIQNKTIKSTNEREEWMMTPGEHNLLESIQRQSVTKERKFQNIKSKKEELNPLVEQELNKIKNEYDALRGPSLLEQYSSKKKEKDQDGDKKDWKWNRGDNLSDGRRVDKDALKMVLGGAKDGLDSKFHTSFSSR